MIKKQKREENEYTNISSNKQRNLTGEDLDKDEKRKQNLI